VVISPDNRSVVTGSDDNTTRLWLLQMKDLLDLARMTVGRNFSGDEWTFILQARSTARRLPTYQARRESNAKKN
jgi:hypothetical protein